MSSELVRDLDIQCDLTLESVGQRTRVVADGRHLRIVTDDAGRVWAQTSAAALPLGGHQPLRLVVGAIADRLDQAGMSAEITDAQGTVIQLGRGRGSWAGRLLTRSPHVTLARPRVLLPSVVNYARARRRSGAGHFHLRPAG